MEKVNDQDSSNPVVETKSQPETPGGNSNPSSSQQPVSGGNKIDGIKAAKNNMQEQFSSVAINSDHKKLVGLLSLVAIGALVYFLFFSGTPTPDKQKDDYNKKIEANKEEIVKQSISLPKVAVNDNTNVVQPAKLPDPLPVADPTPPAPPPAPVPVAPPAPVIINNNKSTPPAPPLPPFIQTAPNSGAGSPSVPLNPFDSSAEERKKMLERKRKAGIMVTGSGKGGAGSLELDKNDKNNKEDDTAKKSSKSEFLGFGNGSLDKESVGKSSAPQVVATKVSDLNRTILQGKIINSVLETAINTDIPGTLRAIVTRDVYSESGNNVLIPKGSRLVGTYESEVKPGQTRVSIMWNRLIRPDGVDIAIESAGTDALGRAGAVGQVDSKFFSQLLNAFLVSYVIPLGAQQLSGSGNNQISTSTSTGGIGTTTTNTGTAKDFTLQQAAQDFSKLASDTVKNNFSSKPTISIDQGTVVDILVQKDLIFPTSIAGSRTVLP
ncbi:MAG: Type IV secretory pathway, VirB10 component [Candidatus Midichloria mitochondrii]|uniref:Type IV secretion system protein VirB10 n=1 Tax=Midichloria mitochondrii (strain IricVA) TaxID=696127 RepID=F7XVQ3_MIDMI|nr:TrbI/VirB10 family protein [Candidatus Midichloria mitochondrii]AEI88752.1 type IV secretion system protein VirB10 [Candidatus Midichloria mitochondrii IricVA]